MKKVNNQNKLSTLTKSSENESPSHAGLNNRKAAHTPLTTNSLKNESPSYAGSNNRKAIHTPPISPLTGNFTRDQRVPDGIFTRKESRPTSSDSSQPSSSQPRRAPRGVRVMVEPFNFLNFTALEYELTFNQHGRLIVSGLIDENNRISYSEMARRETWVHVKALDEEGAESTLFVGILVNLALDSQYQFHTMTIEVKTGSFLFDQTRHTRVFQPNETTYETMIRTCVEASDGEFIMRERKDAQAGQMSIQYKETDYDFFQRLSRRAGIVMLPEYQTEGKRLLFGLTPNSRVIDLDVPHYRMVQGKPDPYSLIRHEWGVYVIETREILELGQSVNFQGRRLIVNDIQTRLKGSELIHRYALCSLKPAYDAQLPFTAIQGASLRGRVTKAVRDRLEITIHEAENKNQGCRRFDFATVYSTPTGHGWFVSADPGDEILLTIPEAQERGAYVLSNVHLEGAENRSNPVHKSWMNKEGMEILFTPTGIMMRDNQGSFIEIAGGKGIIINSTNDISLQSEGQISLNSQDGNVIAYGDRGLNLKQGAAQIGMSDEVTIAGGKLSMN